MSLDFKDIIIDENLSEDEVSFDDLPIKPIQNKLSPEVITISTDLDSLKINTIQ